MSANPYEEARERLELANKACREVRATRDALERTRTVVEAEWAAAERNLRQYEQAPGVPLPQFRVQPEVTTQDALNLYAHLIEGL